MTKFRISIIHLEGDDVISRKKITEQDLYGLRSYFRETFETTDEKIHVIETELQDYRPLRIFETDGGKGAAIEIEPFDE